jgi:hypothetical protein
MVAYAPYPISLLPTSGAEIGLLCAESGALAGFHLAVIAGLLVKKHPRNNEVSMFYIKQKSIASLKRAALAFSCQHS